jgi:hypothetical protein
MVKRIQPADYLACRITGVTVYHTLRWCNHITREFWFTTDPNAVDGEARNDNGQHGAMDNHFDARSLPDQYRTAGVPLDWIQRALLDGFDLGSITNKNALPESAERRCNVATRAIDIWKTVDGESYTKNVTLASCPLCHGHELIVSDVEVQGRKPEDYPNAVHCGGCGARGSWSKTEEGAVVAWNNASEVDTASFTDWRHVPHVTIDDGDSDIPF